MPGRTQVLLRGLSNDFGFFEEQALSRSGLNHQPAEPRYTGCELWSSALARAEPSAAGRGQDKWLEKRVLY